LIVLDAPVAADETVLVGQIGAGATSQRLRPPVVDRYKIKAEVVDHRRAA